MRELSGRQNKSHRFLPQMYYTGCFIFSRIPPPKSTTNLILARLGVSRPICINVDSPSLGFPYFLGGYQLKKHPISAVLLLCSEIVLELNCSGVILTVKNVVVLGHRQPNFFTHTKYSKFGSTREIKSSCDVQ